MSGAPVMTKAEMRAKMPLVSAFIDDLRSVFGEAEINNCIRRGLHPICKPDETFFASEGGMTLGKRAVYPSGSRMVTPVVVQSVIVGRAKV